MRAPLVANKIDGDCFALVRAHQHGITIHNQDVMTERVSGVIYYLSHIIMGVGEGELGNSKVSIVYSIRLGLGGGVGGGGGGGGGEGGRTEVPLCSLSPLIAVDDLKLRIDCPLNNE